MTDAEIPLVGGRSTEGVVLIGDAVHRPAGPWTPTVHAFLRHVRDRGVKGVPGPRGFDERGREVLGFIPGDVLATPQRSDGPLVLVPYPASWRSDEALAAAGSLIRSLHEAAVGFHTTNATWRLCDRSMREGEIICHGDLGPWNTVYVDGVPAAFLDWDSCRPDDPLLDLAAAAWNFVPLGDEAESIALGYRELDHRARIRVFLDAYGHGDLPAFADALQRVKQRQADNVRFWRLDADGAADYFERIARDLRWLAAHADAIVG